MLCSGDGSGEEPLPLSPPGEGMKGLVGVLENRCGRDKSTKRRHQAPFNHGQEGLLVDGTQQGVDADLGAGLGIHLLDDDGGVQAVLAALGGQGAGDDHGAGRDAAIVDLAGFTVIDAGGLADEDTHGDDGALLDDHPSTTSERAPMKQLVFDDGRVGLQRLQHATDADAAGEVHVLADLGQEPTVAQVSTMVPSSTKAPDVDVGGHQHGIGAMKEPLRAVAGGTTRTPAALNCSAL